MGLRGRLLAGVLLCRAASLAWAAAGTIRVLVEDASSQPVADVRLELHLGQDLISTIQTDQQGRARFDGLSPAQYEISASKKGCQTVDRPGVELASGGAIDLELTIIPSLTTRDSIDVQGNVEPLETTASAPVAVAAQELKDLPSRPATVIDALPVVPGVVREPGGALVFSAAPEHRTAMIVNSADVTDPATGQFGLTVPIDSVETLNVYQTPFLAEYGRFTAGLVSVETRRGGEKWKWELNDPLPEFFIHSWHLRGLRDATPRFNFEGPLVPGKLYISEGIDFEIRKIPVYTLPFPFNQKKQTGVNSFAQLDWVISPRHMVTATVHVAPQRMAFVNIDYFNPQPTSPDATTHNYTSTLGDHLSIFGGMLDSTFSVTRFDARVWGQGPEDLTLTPIGNTGNYFTSQNREAARYAGSTAYSVAPLHLWGTHNFKLGGDVGWSHEDGQVTKHTVDIAAVDHVLLQQISFMPGLPFEISDLAYAAFAQDHWLLGPHLAIDGGMRVGSQELTETVLLAPRAGISWNPFGAATAIHAGFGWFYDRVPLNIYAFQDYPREIITNFAPDGSISGGPYLFKNTLGQVFRHHQLIFQGPQPGNFAPQSSIWTLQIEQPVSRNLKLRAGYTQNDANGLVTVDPEGPDLATDTGGFLLSGSGGAHYRQFEATARVRLRSDSRQLFFSYVYSRARGDLNDFNNYLGSFPGPIIRAPEFGNLPFSLPHRFLMWGVVQLPVAFRIAPTLEYRDGFPYAATNALQEYAGIPYQNRYPAFFSLDSRISRDIRLSPKYSIRLSLASFNLTNHFNPEAMHSNIADPAYGYFFGQRGRRFTMDFDILF